MKYKIFIDKEMQDDIKIYAREKTELIQKIEELIMGEAFNLFGSLENEVIKLNLEDIFCFMTENNKIFAYTKNQKLQIKFRLYQLEEKLPNNFIKINQSSIINIEKIEKFSASSYGTLTVALKNGITDYVSRRNIRKVKERFGFKK